MADKLTEITQKLDTWRNSHAAPITPYDDEKAHTLLIESKMTPESIKEHLAKLRLGDKPATPRTIAWYGDLQGLDHIDKADGYFTDKNLDKGTARAVFQAAEIAVLNLRDLVARAKTDIDAGRFGEAAEKFGWINALHHTLHGLSNLCPQVIRGEASNGWLSIANSDNLRSYATDLEGLHKSIIDKGLISKEMIASGQLHNPGRFISFHEFINRNYEDIWRLNLSSVPIPGTSRADMQNPAQFYRDFVGTKEMDLAVNELHQPGDNFFTQFRCYHQMSEILLKQVNRSIDAAARELLADGSAQTLSHAIEKLDSTQRLLTIVNENIRPIVRNISPAQYSVIRSSLGITSGSYSPNIRGGLFHLYAPVVQAIEWRIMGGKDYAPEQVSTKVQQIKQHRHSSEEARLQHELLRQAVALHQAVRGWREEHIQNPLQQLGNTASLAGSLIGVEKAREFSTYAHGARDVIAPIYTSLTGRTYQPMEKLGPKLANRPSPSFTERVLANTNARAAEEYKEVIDRADTTGSRGH